MLASVSKWGNSIALRIPAAIAKSLHLSDGVRVQLAIENGSLVVRPEPKTFDLEAMLAGITAENLHPETETGLVLGDEF